ncbi:MAG TPA: ATP-dependent helicase HrpB [Gemmatimonadaceae bacterium]|nr:ATP-dependent helicase HrpB [Gemmatimonadaceae bacterium]
MVFRAESQGSLPIDEVLASLHDALATHRSVVLQAPPGAGKTTRVPLALLDAPWLAGQRMVMLEPRRLAARAAARRMALTLGQSVGEMVGVRVRGETRVSTRTRIEVVTEGVLTRMLQSDPSLEGIGLLLFDEYHERSLQADLGLALAMQAQELLRPDLRLLVMSATLDVEAVSAVLGDAPVITSRGRMHPVETRHVPRRDGQRVEGAVAAAVRRALDIDEGSVLAFLPGAGEIRRAHDLLNDGSLPRDVRLHPLYGDLPADAQDAAIAPARPGERKVVLATSIAETSLTIDGVRIVVDGGLSRVPRFSPRTGMTRLETVRVSRASSEQRAGRAGRTAPGVCYRLWAAEEQSGLLARATPEILEADLAAFALDLAVAGVRNGAELQWLDAPPTAGLAQARELLRQLGALDEAERITAHGRAMAEFGVHPRLAHMLLRAKALGTGATACLIAALVEERDVLRRDPLRREADLRLRVAIVSGEGRAEHHDVDGDAVRRVREQSRAWRTQLGVGVRETVDEGAAGRLLALAYPDRVARRRDGAGERYLLRNGLGAVLDDAGALTGSEFLAIAELDGRIPTSRIYLAAPLTRSDVEELFSEQIERVDVVEWDAVSGMVRAQRVERLGAIELRAVSVREPDAFVVARTLLAAITRGDGLALRWSESALRLRERLGFMRARDASWPDVSDAALRDTMERWLLPRLVGLRRRVEVEQLDLSEPLLELLTWEQRRALDALAPTHVMVPTGSRLPVDYGDPAAPVLAVRLQELFGLAETPRIAGGAVPLTLHLLSPARRPVQVTRDLAGFWRSSYFEVRKELRGRYPKHEWPEDPLSAAPTRRAKPKR